ncbi:glutathione S-transferase family protein [Pseudooceanicola sp. 502str34]|uniref:glutathione S-transferase family protein n=1 Tax=Maritimibacter alkaliphilus TaxID=404236 RepID=UPI001C95B94E|nr:glutathione S-transferase [Maritimibacter alkaliphilus]MBY6088808.1 glutathione S-transferase N-terminal domain-containing protein [Maritimibacter alkaliphilus]
MTIKLYCFGESGNAYKAALPLELSGLDWAPEKVDFFGGAHRSKDYTAMNVMGEVPVLVDGDVTLSQSGVIQMYITEKTGKFGGATPEEARNVMKWVFFDNHKMSSQCGMLRFQMNFLPEANRSAEVIGFIAARLKAAFKVLDAGLEGRDWLVGDGPTHADFSNCGYLFYPEPFTFERKDWPNIDRWLSNIESLPGWKHPYDLMPGRPSDRGL